MEQFKVTRVYTDENGDSRFDEVFYPLTDGGPIGHLSQSVAVKEVLFRKVPAGYNDLHTAPQKQYVVLLNGGVEIETSLGEKRKLEQGEVLLMEDTTGKGHRSSNLEQKERSSLFVIF
jgi:quercetin dioxygenase-like cupin family protein